MNGNALRVDSSGGDTFRASRVVCCRNALDRVPRYDLGINLSGDYPSFLSPARRTRGGAQVVVALFRFLRSPPAALL